MNRFLNIPKSEISSFIIQNFRNLTEEEVLHIMDLGIYSIDIYKYNQNIFSSKPVLKKALLHNTNNIEYFDPDIIDTEILDLLVKLNYIPTKEHLEEIPELFDNKVLTTRALMHDITILSMIPDEIESSIESSLGSFIDPGIKNFKDAKQDLQKAFKIKRNPNIIDSFEEINKDMLALAVSKGYTMQADNFYKYSPYMIYENIAVNTLALNPNLFPLFDKISIDKYASVAIKKGYHATQEDLINNPYLCENEQVMKDACTTNPELVKYTRCTFPGLQEVITSKYKLTEADLINNPFLCTMGDVIRTLITKDPSMEKYYTYLNKNRKEFFIKEALQKEGADGVMKLPFFNQRFGSNLNADELRKLLSLMCFPLELDKQHQLDGYFSLFDHVVNALVKKDYENKKDNFKYCDIVSIDRELISSFEEINSRNKEKLLHRLAISFIHFATNGLSKNKNLTYEYVRSMLEKLYQKYVINKKLEFSDTTDFYNLILNTHADIFQSKRKKDYLDHIKMMLPVSAKKFNTIIKGKRIEILRRMLKERKYHLIGITESQLTEVLNTRKNNIRFLKEIRREKIIITDEMFEKLNRAFINDNLTLEVVLNIINANNTKVGKRIITSYSRLLRLLSENIQTRFEQTTNLENLDSSIKRNLNFDKNNFELVSYQKYLDNIAKILLNLDNDTLTEIISCNKFDSEVFRLIPFLEIISTFGLDEFMNVIRYYSKTKHKMSEVLSYNGEVSFNKMMSNFDMALKISKGLSLVDDVHRAIFGEEVSDMIGEENTAEYFKLYNTMLHKKVSNVPKIKGRINGQLTYESGNYQDVTRMMMGKAFIGSCYYLGHGAGEATYKKCLTSEDSDVAIIKDQNGKIVGRIMLFRYGNTILLTQGRNSKVKINEETLKDIGNQILRESYIQGDNIEYIFYDNDKREALDFKSYKNKVLSPDDLHADLRGEAYLIAQSTFTQGSTDNKLGFSRVPKGTYVKERKEVTYNDFVNEEDITRIRALRVFVEPDNDLKKALSKSFVHFKKENYNYIVHGEDWYIAISNEGILEELLISDFDPRAKEEFDKVKLELYQMVSSERRSASR